MDADRHLVAPSGASYRVLVIDPRVRRMTLGTLRRLDILSRGGLVIAGPRPVESPSLADDQAAFSRLASAVWSRPNQTYPTLAAAISALRLTPDAELDNPSLSFVHRTLPDGEVYFVANLGPAPVELTASFRVSGLAPEIWRAVDASITPASYEMAGGRTAVPLALAANDAFFVVFRKPTRQMAKRAPARSIRVLATLAGPWRVDFPLGAGAPASATFPQLASWSDSTVPGIRYFSGTARYTTSLEVREAIGPGRLLLDLGKVANVAQVRVNGRMVGTAWTAPYRVDITVAAHRGRNRLEVDVANLWPNRLIGDQQPGAAQHHVEAAYQPFSQDSPLRPSGLLGPVQLVSEVPGLQ
jgi:hypothetical protein